MSNTHDQWYFSEPDTGWRLTIRYACATPVQFWNFPDSLFDNWCYYWNSTPGGVIYCAGEELELRPDIAVLIPPYTAFATELRCNFRQFYVHFTLDGLYQTVRRMPIILPGNRAQIQVPKLLNCNSEQQELRLRGLLLSELADIPRDHFQVGGRHIIDRRLQYVVKLMRENLRQLPDNQALCRKVGLGINAFYTLFKQELNKTPRQFFIMLRMEHASNLLRRSERTIKQIADECGYSDRYQFSKEFRRFFKVPPAEFRRCHQEELTPAAAPECGKRELPI